ncbi:MAG: SGNH/GDSL hydrolase family protein [Patescibacteria group bacterium]|nr:hypothetical protein [Patescibacteria group bacterium]
MKEQLMEGNEKKIREKTAGFILKFAVLVWLSAFLINPWMGRLWQKDFINYKDVFEIYFLSALVIGLIFVITSSVILKSKREIWLNLGISIFIVSVIILLDRFILLFTGLPVWKYDPDLYFRQRPNVEKTWRYVGIGIVKNQNELFKTNRYGQHDDDFPLKKESNELRGVMLGDSIACGDGLGIEDTFPQMLEQELNNRDTKFKKHQIINTGVHGYWTYQERRVMEESLIFRPDFFALGFAMNDVEEAKIFDKNYGGPGFDPFRRVFQSRSRFLGYLLNETGFGRLMINYKSRKIWMEKVKENIDSIERTARRLPSDPEMEDQWRVTLTELDKMKLIADKQGIPLVILIFPVFEQLGRKDWQNTQKMLIAYAKKRDIDYLDFTPIFEEKILAGGLSLLDKCESDSLTLECRQLAEKYYEYYTDGMHFTPESNRLVAQKLFEYLEKKGLITVKDDKIRDRRR